MVGVAPASTQNVVPVMKSLRGLSVHWLEWLAVGAGRKVIGRSQQITYFYLLETTRPYAAEKLIESARVARRRAQYFAAFFERAEADLETGPRPVFLDAHSRRIDDYGLH
jgi:predicted ATPase